MDTSFGPEVLFGWHSTFDSGLNVAAAAKTAVSETRLSSNAWPGAYLVNHLPSGLITRLYWAKAAGQGGAGAQSSPPAKIRAVGSLPLMR